MKPFVATLGGRMTVQTDVDPIPYSLPELEGFLLQTSVFLLAFVVTALVGWAVVEPAISRVVTRRNRNNPTLEEAITRYLRLMIAGVALFVATSAAGFTGLVGNSALVVAAGTLALGIAGQSVIGSLVSGTALVVDPEFSVGNYIRWEDGEGEVTSITLRVTRVQTPDGGLVTIPNTTLTEGPISKPFGGGRPAGPSTTLLSPTGPIPNEHSPCSPKSRSTSTGSATTRHREWASRSSETTA